MQHARRAYINGLQHKSFALSDYSIMLSPFLFLLSALACAPLQVFTRQIPIVDGVLGGVRETTETPERFTSATTTPAATTPGKLRVVENSGVCETTPGVYQASGYGDLTSNESIWYGSSDFAYIVTLTLPLGSGSSQHARTLILRPWLFGSMVGCVNLTNEFDRRPTCYCSLAVLV